MICWTSIGPVVRAGLIEAPVVGATGMIAAKTAVPISEARPAGRRLAVDDAEHGEHQRKVPTNSAKKSLVQRDRVAVRRDPEAEVTRLGAEHANDGERSGNGAEDLRGHVAYLKHGTCPSLLARR